MAATYNDLYLEARKILKEAAFDESSLEARRLLALACNCSDSELIARFSYYVSDETVAKYKALLARRIKGEPMAYIAGEWEFHGLPLYVTPDVLIPRIDTEVLVEKALSLANLYGPDLRILDLCSGSGCITCALAEKLPQARFVLADISSAAMAVARRNISRHGFSSRCICIDADALNEPPIRTAQFDLICCNPPYISAAELKTLDSSVIDFEPTLALDGGEDGYIFYNAILEKWLPVLKEKGYILFEVGEEQSEPVMSRMREAKLTRISAVKDTAGTERVVLGQKKENI